MPLLFVVLVIVLICASSASSMRPKPGGEKDPPNVDWSETTNAAKERSIMDDYVKRGYSFDDAYRKTRIDIQELGFTPCIPRAAYSKRSENSWDKTVTMTTDFRAEQYDSGKVQAWYRNARTYFYGQPNGYPGGVPNEIFQEKVYNHRKKDWEFEVYRPVPIGEFVIHPVLGECEVLDYYFYGNPVNSGRYKLRVAQTGEVTTDIVIGDRDLRRKC